MRTIDGSEPHPDYGGWERFLATCCEVRDAINTADGIVIYYGATNCNYVLLPNGYIIENFGYHGTALMGDIRRKGWRNIWLGIVTWHREIKVLLNRLRRNERPLSKQRKGRRP